MERDDRHAHERHDNDKGLCDTRMTNPRQDDDIMICTGAVCRFR
jgi:hypothetical protein